jgi:hypothetical protein
VLSTILTNVTETILNTSPTTDDDAQQSSFLSKLMSPLESFDYYRYQDSLITAVSQPVSYFLFEVPFSTKVYLSILAFILLGVLIPLCHFTYKYIKALCHPITFSYKHVLITGCTGGLGKALVQEIFMKGAYITMVGRDREVLQKIAE